MITVKDEDGNVITLPKLIRVTAISKIATEHSRSSAENTKWRKKVNGTDGEE